MKHLAQAALTAVLIALFALILLVMFAGKASAQTIATSPTQAGGEIRLMIDDCTRADLPDREKRMAAYIRTSDNKLIVGCWKNFDGQVEVDYEIIGKRFYPYSGFTTTKFGDQVIKKFDEMRNAPNGNKSML